MKQVRCHKNEKIETIVIYAKMEETLYAVIDVLGPFILNAWKLKRKIFQRETGIAIDASN